MNTLFSPLIHGAKSLLIGLKNLAMVISSLCGTNLSTFPYFEPALHRMVTNSDSLCPRCKEQEESHPRFMYHCRLSQITLDFINKLINLYYTFRTHLKSLLKKF